MYKKTSLFLCKTKLLAGWFVTYGLKKKNLLLLVDSAKIINEEYYVIKFLSFFLLSLFERTKRNIEITARLFNRFYSYTFIYTLLPAFYLPAFVTLHVVNIIFILLSQVCSKCTY